MLTPEIADQLAELAAAGAAHDAAADRDRHRLNLDPATAAVLAVVATAAGARRAVEVGTSNGYSTVWLAAHVGHLTSIDRDPAKHDAARANLRRAGLLDRVELRAGDATTVVAALAAEGGEPIDLLFFDADRRSAPRQLELLLPRLSARCVVAHDNALSHADELAEYLAAVGRLPGFVHAVVPVGKGLSVASRNG